MITQAQLRMLIERSFSPLACECSVTGDHSLTVKLYHPVSGQVDLVVGGACGSGHRALLEVRRHGSNSRVPPRLRRRQPRAGKPILLVL